MDNNEFLKQQYVTLREEIRDSKARIFRIMGFGLTIVPAANFVAQTYKVDAITLSLPILVVVIALVFLAENNALMRCGSYIKDHIEPNFPKIVGWETWLQIKKKWNVRNVDIYVSYAFHILFLVYFIGSVLIARNFCIITYGTYLANLLLSTYVIIGVWFVIYLFQNILTSTRS